MNNSVGNLDEKKALSYANKALIGLFVPIFFETVLRYLMSTVNVLILGQYSDNAVASVGVASQVLNLALLIYAIVCTGASIVVSQNIGANNEEKASNSASVTISLVAILGILVGIILNIFAKNFIMMIGLEANLVDDAALFLKIVGGISVFQAVITAFLQPYQGVIKKAYIAMIVIFLMNLLNALGSYLVVFRPFEIPLHGIGGVAVLRVCSEFISLIVMIILINKFKIPVYFKKMFKFSKKIVLDILKIGIPSGVETFSYNISQLVSTAIIATFGALSISTRIYVDNIVIYVSVFSLSIGQATAILIGRLVGAKDFDLASKLNKRSLFMALIINGSLAALVAIFRYNLISLFTQDERIISIAVVILVLDFFVEIGRAINHVEQNAIRGTGDARYLMLTSLFSGWCISILFSYIFGIVLGFGLKGCWIAFAMDEFFRGTMHIFRWRSGKWKNKALIDN